MWESRNCIGARDMDKPQPISFNLTELLSALRHMRRIRDELRQAIRELQERMRLGHDGHHNAAMVVLTGELAVVEECVRKLWEAFQHATPSRPPDVGP